ncbi:DUF4197 domain-containing protein [Marinoscillum sp.]|uniref:DUF4197 domain-containing protein n=1 Tax=Marinoscillum sp. TaxID=2024838 RepID=UPI003BAB6352
MRLVLFSLCLIFLFTGCTVQQIQQTLGDYMESEELTTDQVIAGLKEALVKGAESSTADASRVNGFLGNPKIKIPFPPEVQRVEDKLREIGLGNQVDRFVETLNHGAEEAAKEAKPIFVSAIKGMTVQDAWGILKGQDNAATQYLQDKTSAQLKNKFQPVIKKALDQTSATKYYSDLVNTYNKIPFVDKVNPNLDEYATERALAGLFTLVADEEKKIRDNPAARTTELLKKVFAKQD